MIYHGSGTPRLKLLSTCRRLVSYARAVWRRKWLTRSFSAADKILPRSPPTLEVGVEEGGGKKSGKLSPNPFATLPEEAEEIG